MEGGSRGRADKRRALLNNIYAEIDKNISLTLVMIHSKNITEILRNNIGKITSHLHVILVIETFFFLTLNFPALLVSFMSSLVAKNLPLLNS